MGKNTPHIRPLLRDIERGNIASGNINTTPIILKSAIADKPSELVRGAFSVCKLIYAIRQKGDSNE